MLACWCISAFKLFILKYECYTLEDDTSLPFPSLPITYKLSTGQQQQKCAAGPVFEKKKDVLDAKVVVLCCEIMFLYMLKNHVLPIWGKWSELQETFNEYE